MYKSLMRVPRTEREPLPLARASILSALIILICTLFGSYSRAQESPYIVAYDHYLEEPGNLDVEYFSTFGTQRGSGDFHAFWMEFEYGATAWWTTEFYLDAQTTFHDSTLFTGFRWKIASACSRGNISSIQ